MGKKCIAFLLCLLMVLEPAAQAALAADIGDSGTSVLDTEDITAEMLTVPERELDPSDDQGAAEDTMELSLTSESPEPEFSETLPENWEGLYASELPVYKDHILYGQRTGNVLLFENYTALGSGKRYVIQSSVNGVPVREIESEALYGVVGDATILVPNSVKTIAPWNQLTCAGFEGAFTGKATIVCDDNSAAKTYAMQNGLATMTRQEDQKRVDSTSFSKKVLTVMYNKPKNQWVQDNRESNNYVAADNNVTVTVVEPTTEKRETLDKSGSATIRASNAAKIKVEREGYITQELAFKEMEADLEKDTKVYLEKETDGIYIKSVVAHYTEDNGTVTKIDAYHSKYLVDRLADDPTTLEAEVVWGTHGAGTIQLWQDGSTETFSGNILTYVLKNKFDTASSMYIIATAGDGTSVKKKLNIEASDLALDGLELDFSSHELTLPNKIPWVGGETIGIDLGKLPCDICIENGKAYIVIGFASGSYNKSTTTHADGHVSQTPEKDRIKGQFFEVKNDLKNFKKPSEFKNEVASIFRKYKSGLIKPKVSKKSITGDIEVLGYLEVVIRPNGTMKISDGQIIVKASGSLKFGGNFTTPTVPPVPIYWSITFGADFEGKVSAQVFHWSAASFYPYGSLSLEVSLTGEGGAGIENLLSGGIGATGSTKISFNFKTDLIHYKWGGKASFFVRVTALFLEYKKSWDIYEGTWIEGNWNYPGGKNSMPAARIPSGGTSYTEVLATIQDPSSYRVQDQSYLYWPGEFMANDDFGLFGLSTDVTPFKGNVYAMPDSQLVQLDNGTRIMIWLDGGQNRVSPNMTSVYYSYQPSGGMWSEPREVEADGTADFQPVLRASGDTAWLAWSSAKQAFSQEELESDPDAGTKAASSMEIRAAQFTGSGFSEVYNLTDNAVYDHTPAIAVGKDGNAKIYWLQSGDNVLTDTGSETQIMGTDWTGETWTTESVVSAPGCNVVSLDAGYVGDDPQYVATLDTDGDPVTTDDLELWVDGQYLTSNAVADSGAMFCNGVLYWVSDGIIRDEAGKALLPDSMQLGSDRFQVYCDETGRLAVVFTLSDGAYAEVYGVFVDPDKGTISQPTQLTKTGERMEAGVGFYSAENGLVLPCALTTVTNNGEFSGGEAGSEDAELPFGQTDLALLTYGEESNLVIEDVYFDESRLVAGNNFTVNVLVKNTGVLPAKGFDVVLWDDEGHMPVPTGEGTINPKAADYRATDFLPGGEEMEVPLTFLLPENFEGTYTITLTPSNDANFSDETVRSKAKDRRSVTFSSKDIILRAEALQAEDGSPVVKATIGNCGAGDCTLPLSLYAVTTVQGEEGIAQNEQLLQTSSVSVEEGSQETVSFALTGGEAAYDYLRVEVATVEGEINTTNNSDFCVLQSIGEEGSGAASVSILRYTPGSGSVSADIEVALPSDTGSCALVVAGYNSSGKMLCSRCFPNVSNGRHTVSLAGTSISYIQCFLTNAETSAPLCKKAGNN